MVAQGTNDGGSNMNRERRTANGDQSPNGFTTKQTRYPKQDSPRRFNKPDGESRYDKSEGQGRYGKPEGGNRYSRGEGTTSRYGRGEGGYTGKPYDKNRSFNSAPKFSGKDEDEEDNSRRSRPSRPKESKPGVAIPDKNKVQLRIEKEQKSMKKKQQNKKKESTRPQPKVKRANNINYTKNYANGDYDDYDDYYDL
ncbi:MAG: hypothetical protein PUA62_05360 [Lachnospiraceae bacterium]|nr:hypothetical protein [Lachnospiraceae bacterium]